MSLDPKRARYGLREVKISKLLTDPSGGSATYDNPVALPAAQTIEITPEIQSAQLEGDDTIVALFAQLDGFKGKIGYGKANLDAEAVLLGGTRADSGTTPNQIAELTHSSGQSLPYFKIEGRVVDADGASTDIYLQILKCRVTGMSESSANKKFGEQSLDFMAVRRESDSKMYVKQARETGSALSSAADTTAPTIASVSPADAATGVAVGANIVVTFSEAMRADTMNTSNIFVAKDDGTIVAGTLTYNSGTFAATFDPTSNLAAVSNYNVIVTTGCRDAAGNALANPSVTQFTTA